MSRYIVAVSGGVDSVVLLDILARSDHRIIVAHVDHGIRGADSQADARFVEALAAKYRFPYVQTELKLGPQTSEEEARAGRYQFLLTQAAAHHAELVTAHHRDDLVGSIAINLQRGTGWRGLSVLNRAGVKRPLLGWTKQQIYNYALDQRLEWVEDRTNRSDRYLRNRMRHSVSQLSEASQRQLEVLRQRQLQLRYDIDYQLARLAERFADRRYPYIQIEPRMAIEILRYRLALTYPQAERTLHSIKTGRAGTKHDIAGGVVIKLSRDRFVVASHLE